MQKRRLRRPIPTLASIIYEGSYQSRIVRDASDEKATAQALLALRVAVTRAVGQTSILTPKHDPCPFL